MRRWRSQGSTKSALRASRKPVEATSEILYAAMERGIDLPVEGGRDGLGSRVDRAL